MQLDMTRGPVTRSILMFATPMILGNLLQQFYNIADTLIVGRYLGPQALAAVGASYPVMVFLTSVLLGLCMGSGVLFSMLFGSRQEGRMKTSFVLSFALIGLLTVLIEGLSLAFTQPLMRFLQIPAEVFDMTGEYLRIVLYGLGFTFLYNYFASLLRALGNSTVPLAFLAVSAVVNIVLDLLFVLRFELGVAGAAYATVIAQFLSALGIALYTWVKMPQLRPAREHFHYDGSILRQLVQYSLLTCVQQSVMNFGILMVQGLVNSFGVATMAAFAAAVKIDSFAYMPVQDFGNAFSTYIAQNQGAGETARIRQGLRSAVICSAAFCVVISLGVVFFGRDLMCIFIDAAETEILDIGAQYLRIEGACYIGIGCLFLFYGLFRGLGQPGVSVVLTVISLGTRVALAYLLAPIPEIGLLGIWWSIPIGWFLADAAGVYYYLRSPQLHPAKAGN